MANSEDQDGTPQQAKTKSIFRERNTIYFGNYYL